MWQFATSIGNTIGLSLCLLAGPGFAKPIAGDRLAAGPVHSHEQPAHGRGWHKEGTHHGGLHEGVHRVDGTAHIGISPHHPQIYASHPQPIDAASHRPQFHLQHPPRTGDPSRRPQFHPQHPQRIGELSHRGQIHAHGPHHSIAPTHHLPAKKY